MCAGQCNEDKIGGTMMVWRYFGGNVSRDEKRFLPSAISMAVGVLLTFNSLWLQAQEDEAAISPTLSDSSIQTNESSAETAGSSVA